MTHQAVSMFVVVPSVLLPHLQPLEYGLLWTQTFKLVWFNLFSALVSRPFVVYKKTIWWLFMLARSKHVPDFRFPWIEINYHCKDHQGWLRRSRVQSVGSALFCPFESRFLSQRCIEAPENKNKISDHQLKNSTQYLISGVTPIVATCDNHLLVQVSSSETTQRPGTILLCTEQHFWKGYTSRCIRIGVIMVILMMIVCMIILQLDDGFNN